MDIGKTGSILFQMYVGTLALIWSVVMILGGGALVYLGMEPFKTRGMIMIGLGAVVLLISGLRIGSAAKKPKEPQLASDAQRDFDADEAIRRYLEQKTEAAPASAAATELSAAAPAPPLLQRPVFGRRGTA
jgi:hypothetical protein